MSIVIHPTASSAVNVAAGWHVIHSTLKGLCTTATTSCEISGHGEFCLPQRI
jgi:hypothetical protein